MIATLSWVVLLLYNNKIFKQFFKFNSVFGVWLLFGIKKNLCFTLKIRKIYLSIKCSIVLIIITLYILSEDELKYKNQYLYIKFEK